MTTACPPSNSIWLEVSLDMNGMRKGKSNITVIAGYHYTDE